MNNEKMREEFEKWVYERYVHPEEVLRNIQSYAWDSWQAAVANVQYEIEPLIHDLDRAYGIANAETEMAIVWQAKYQSLSKAIENLIKVKGRHHTEQAYTRLVEVFDEVNHD